MRIPLRRLGLIVGISLYIEAVSLIYVGAAFWAEGSGGTTIGSSGFGAATMIAELPFLFLWLSPLAFLATSIRRRPWVFMVALAVTAVGGMLAFAFDPQLVGSFLSPARGWGRLVAFPIGIFTL